MKVAAYLYIGGLNNGSVRANLMTNWQPGKYATLMELQTDAAKTLYGALRQLLHRGQAIRILTIIRVKPLSLKLNGYK